MSEVVKFEDLNDGDEVAITFTGVFDKTTYPEAVGRIRHENGFSTRFSAGANPEIVLTKKKTRKLKVGTILRSMYFDRAFLDDGPALFRNIRSSEAWEFDVKEHNREFFGEVVTQNPESYTFIAGGFEDD